MTVDLEKTVVRPPLARQLWRHWVVWPVVFGLTALPLTLTGRRSRLACLRPDSGRTPDRTAPVLLMLPLATVSFVLVATALLTVYTGELYPLRPETIGHIGHLFSAFPGGDEAWGGPTLIGAWFVHALVGLGIQILALSAVRMLAAVTVPADR